MQYITAVQYLTIQLSLQTFGQQNIDNLTPMIHKIDPPFKARFVRLHPDSYQGYPCIRWEVMGRPLRKWMFI